MWAMAGGGIGGVIGFLLRPSVPFLGQLPFQTVITRGINLTGLEVILRGTAEQSFNYLLVGVIVGIVAGVVVSKIRTGSPVRS